jgi:hypothetical protein
LGFNLINGSAELIVSYSPHGPAGGLGVCFGLGSQALGVSGSAGFAYHWGDTWLNVLGDINIGSCDNNWLDRQVGVNVQAASAGRGGPRASMARAHVPSGLSAVNLHVYSATGAPDITVTAPNGVRASTAGSVLGRAVKGPSFELARVPVLNETIIVPTHPLAGRYKITTNLGSPPITRIVRSDGYRPAISAHVTGRGAHLHLAYRFPRRPGQLVRFFEISGQVHRLLGTTTGGLGSIAFTASTGHGRRQIVAEVYGDGVPRVRQTVTSYLAPAPVHLGRPGHLRVRRIRSRATVTFTGVRSAAEYRINMTLTDGTRKVITTRARRVTFGPIFVDIGGTITVQAIGDGLHSITGPSVRHRLAPLFGPKR